MRSGVSSKARRSTSTGQADNVVELGDGILRITFALPLGIDHVHCYALRSHDGACTVVDTGLGLPDAQAGWEAVLRVHGLQVARIVVTHFHPDHVGAAAPLARLTNAPVLQGTLDYAQCTRAWSGEDAIARLVAYMREHGLPDEDAEQLCLDGNRLRRLVHYARDPQPLEPGDDVDGWRILHLPGHADGHLCLLRDGVLIAGDALLASITPTVGLYPDARPDPLGDYLDSLERIVELAPATAHAGHGDTIEDPPQRARELVAHHRERLAYTREALSTEPRTAYEVSLRLFPEPLAPVLRRFALAESRAHLEYLALRGEVTHGGSNRYALA